MNGLKEGNMKGIYLMAMIAILVVFAGYAQKKFQEDELKTSVVS